MVLPLHLPKKNMKFFKITAPFNYLLLLFVSISFIVRFILFFHPITQTSLLLSRLFIHFLIPIGCFNFVLLSLFYGFTFYLYQMLNTIPHMDM
jgi:hypothetical protein